MAFSVKQQLFVNEYLIDLNATQAAIRAGYSPKTARSVGAENLTKPDIKSAVNERIHERSDALIAKEEEVLKTLTRILRREERECVVVTIKDRTCSFDKNGKKKITEKETPQIVEILPKLSDTIKAAELLGRHLGMYNDKLRVNMDSPVIIYGGDLLED